MGTSIAHVSLDVWNTLVRPNPTFAGARSHLLSMMFNVDYELVAKAYTKVKDNINYSSSIHSVKHGAPSTHRAYEMLLHFLDADTTKATMVRQMVDELFINHPPFIVDSAPYLIAQLNRIGCGVSIGSNSNFISGSIMYPFLKRHVGDFDFGVFSDLIGTQKPGKLFFDHVVGSVNALFTNIPAREILHVGDDHECDEVGPTLVGMSSLRLMHDRPLAVQVLNHIDDLQQGVA